MLSMPFLPTALLLVIGTQLSHHLGHSLLDKVGMRAHQLFHLIERLLLDLREGSSSSLYFRALEHIWTASCFGLGIVFLYCPTRSDFREATLFDVVEARLSRG